MIAEVFVTPLAADSIRLRHDEIASIWLHPARKVVHHQIHQPLPTAQLRSLLSEAARCLIDHRATKWLADDRQLDEFDLTLLPWIEQELLPRTISGGWRHWALILPMRPGAARLMRDMAARLAISGLTVFVFHDPETANAWLDAQ
jgi:hypothetical protein